MSEIETNKAATIDGADYDVVVVGAGFGGLYSVYKFRDEQGLKVKAFDNAPDVGGTWHWNRYPGALSDTETFVYGYSFDKELLQEWPLEDRYVTQPEILKYLKHFADRYDIRRSYQFNTKVTSARFNEATSLWDIETDKGDKVTAQYIITGLGLLSAINLPDIKGLDSFAGQLIHTGDWPGDGVDLSGKRVGVIGTGSTGTQVITAIAPEVGHLTVFQRSPQYTIPVRQRPLTDEEVQDIRANYDAIWEQVMGSGVAFGFVESTTPASEVSEEEQQRVFEAAWEKGGGFRYMFETFSDIATDAESNEAAAAFIRKKISEIVTDPETAAKLTPHDLYAKRPLCDSGYYATFNRENVSLVDVKANPIAEITPTGVRTSDGALHELDVLVFATGFDAVDGNYIKIDIRGRNGLQIKDKWADGPNSYLGTVNDGYPNMFMILGPNGPFTNLPPSIETQVEWFSQMVKDTRADGKALIEVKKEAVDGWSDSCAEIADFTLFPKAESWIFAANIPGKKNAVQFYLGGLGAYRGLLQEEKDSGYANFKLEAAQS